MPYYQDTNGGLHFLDDAAFSHLLPDGCVELSDADAKAIEAKNQPPVDPNAALKTEITQLEQKGIRSTRDVLAAMAGGQTPAAADVTQLQSIASQIQALRAQFK
jgi:hypothetical protein